MKHFPLAALNASLLAASLISFAPAVFDFDYKSPGDPGKSSYQRYSGPVRIFLRRVAWWKPGGGSQGWRVTDWKAIQDGDTVLVLDYDTHSLVGIEQWIIEKRGIVTVKLKGRKVVMELGVLSDGAEEVSSLFHYDAGGLRAGAR